MSQEPEQKRDLTPYSESGDRVGMLRGMVESATLTWRLFWDKRVNLLVKSIPVLSIVYLISPIDVIPEFLIPAIGPLVAVDDITLLIGAMALFIQLAPPDVVSEHRRMLRAQGMGEPDYDEDDIIDSEAEIIE